MDIVSVVAVAVVNSAPTQDRQEEREKPSPPDQQQPSRSHLHLFVPLSYSSGEVTGFAAHSKPIFYLCIPKTDLAKPHFFYRLNISRTKFSVWNYDIL
jgi:hypothetical protein